MVSTDPISDMLSRIRNAIAVSKTEVDVPYSKIKQTVAQKLVDNNFLDDLSVDDSTNFKRITLVINQPGTNARITHIKRLSKPGRRMYVKADEIPKVKSGRGIVLVSTSQGLMTGSEASKSRLGGELICEAY